MKVARMIIIGLIVCVTFYANANQASIPTTEQIDKLITAAWKEPPKSIDITLYKDISRPPQSVEEIRQMFEEKFNKMEGYKDSLHPAMIEQRNRDIQLNVERTFKQQQAGQTLKQRIRIDGHRQRIDQVMGWPEMELLRGTPHRQVRPAVILGPDTPYNITYINLGDPNKGDYRSFAYYDEMKSATKSNSKNLMWARSEIMEFATLASLLQGILGTKKGESNEILPDESKIEQFKKNGCIADGICLAVSPAPTNPDTNDRIEIKSPESSGGTVLICDKEDYSRIYYIELSNYQTGKPLYIRQCDDFDFQGFPHSITVTKFNVDGQFEKSEIYTIESVILNPFIPDDVFEFNPPEDYSIVENDTEGKSRVIRERSDVKGKIQTAMTTLSQAAKEKDAETIKELLHNEIWQVRLRSLQVLEVLLENDKKALKNAARVLEKDDNLSVQEKAKSILSKIEANESESKTQK